MEPEGLPPFNEASLRLFLKGHALSMDELVKHARLQTQLLQAILAAQLEDAGDPGTGPVRVKRARQSKTALREAAEQEIGGSVWGFLFGKGGGK